MSVEAITISAIVDDGASALRKLYGKGVTAKDFALYDSEFKWIERRLATRKPLNRRVFRQKFQDFDFMPPKGESIDDLAHELKEERAYEELNSFLHTLSEELQPDNAIDLAVQGRELLGKLTRKHAPF